MATGNNKPQRFASCRNIQKTIRFDQIKLEQESYCHRQNDKLGPVKLQGLATSLAQEGQQTPLICIKGGGESYTLVAGYRRFCAIRKGIEESLPGCREDMEVLVTIIEKGEGQSDDEFQEDVLVRSVSDNENRISFDDNERLVIVKRFQEQGVYVERGMAALGVKRSQYDRYLNIISQDWLYEAVLKGHLKSTHAAHLVEEAKKHDKASDRSKVLKSDVNRMTLLEDGLGKWITEARGLLDEENRWLLAQGKSAREGKDAHLSRYFSGGRLSNWKECLKKGQSLGTGHWGEFEFLVNVDVKKLSLEIPKVTLKSDDLTSEKLETVIGGLEEGITKVAELLVEVERRNPITSTETEAVVDRVRQKRSGESAEDFNTVEEVEIGDVAKQIEEQQRQQDDDDAEEVDD